MAKQKTSTSKNKKWNVGDVVVVSDRNDPDCNLRGDVVEVSPKLVVMFYKTRLMEPKKLASAGGAKTRKKTAKVRAALALVSGFKKGQRVCLKANPNVVGIVERDGTDPITVRFDPRRDDDVASVPANDLRLWP